MKTRTDVLEIENILVPSSSDTTVQQNSNAVHHTLSAAQNITKHQYLVSRYMCFVLFTFFFCLCLFSLRCLLHTLSCPRGFVLLDPEDLVPSALAHCLKVFEKSSSIAYHSRALRPPPPRRFPPGQFARTEKSLIIHEPCTQSSLVGDSGALGVGSPRGAQQR